MRDVRRVGLALACGILAHGTFLVAVATMAVGLWTGLESGRGGLRGPAALAADAALVLQFPLLHSFLLSRRGQSLLAAGGASPWGRTLATTTYAWIASLQLLATFWLWSPSGVEWWRPPAAGRAPFVALFAASWVFLGLALVAAGLGLQTGWLGWSALLRDRSPRFPDLPTRGPFALCRQPIYLGFALTLWTGAVWTPDRLLLALAWSAYCVVGPLHKEARFRARYGERFAAYAARVPYLPVRVPRRGPALRPAGGRTPPR